MGGESHVGDHGDEGFGGEERRSRGPGQGRAAAALAAFGVSTAIAAPANVRHPGSAYVRVPMLWRHLSYYSWPGLFLIRQYP